MKKLISWMLFYTINTMDALPIELVHVIACIDMGTYHALMTAYPRYSRSIPAIPREGYTDRFDMMMHFGYSVSTSCGCIVWTLNNHAHMNGAPAVICNNHVTWYQWGKIHRNDGPAVVNSDGAESYYYYGKWHRTDGPAVVYDNGRVMGWYQHGKRHRVDGPAQIYPDAEYYYQHGELHREDGPAIDFGDGRTEWYKHGLRHRVGGPAITCADGTTKYYIDGRYVGEK